MSETGEDVLTLIRSLPVAVQEGQQQSMELLKHVVRTAVT